MSDIEKQIQAKGLTAPRITPADVPIQAWPIVARLKYAVKTGVVEFWYDLIRPDQVHEQAALAMIEQIRAGIGEVPLRLGTCK